MMANGPEFDARFRPLLSATVGAGAVSLGLMDFTANAWGDVVPASRALIAMAARTAFLVFVMNVIVLTAAYLFNQVIGARLSFCFNLFGAAMFLGGTYLSGGLLTRALDIASPGGATPPDSVQTLLGLGGVAIILLSAVLTFIGLNNMTMWLREAVATRPVVASSDAEEESAAGKAAGGEGHVEDSD